MIVKGLFFAGFRNLKDGFYEPGPGVNILCGKNAQGKTNLLEALWLFTGSKSFRGAKDSELIRFGEKCSRIRLKYTAYGKDSEAELSFDGSRRAALNGIDLQSAAQLAGEFCCVIFSPEHLRLIKDGPQQRRRFIDYAVCQIHPRYTVMLLEYKKVLSQRNALLKDIPHHAELLDTLGIWDDKLSASGAQITYTRLRYLKKLQSEACSSYKGISCGGEELSLSYNDYSGCTLDIDLSNRPAAVRSLAEMLSENLLETRSEDILSGYTHAGPHREDISILIDGVSARSFGSQGQQRSAVLALKLAESAALREGTGEEPVLLLDDVLSELDLSRQEYLLKNITKKQIFITCCDPVFYKALEETNITEVRDGILL